MSEIVGAVIVAAGSGVRMHGADKLFTQVAGRPVLAHTIAAVDECWCISRIVVVLSEENVERGRELIREHQFKNVTGVCTGGARRQDSVLCGLRELEPVDYVAVHDGARPLVKPGMINRGLEAARATGAAVPVLPIADTVKEIDETGLVLRTVDRSRLAAVQTPQLFRYELLLRAHEEITEDVTDCAAMVERLGVRVATFEGRRPNIKITTPEDLAVAEAYLD